MSDDMAAYRDVFLSESAEYLQAIVDGLLALESNPGDMEPVETVFRGAHSLKGMAAVMGYDLTADITHRMESLMDTVRSGSQAVDSTLIDLMLRAVDTVKELITAESQEAELPDTEGMVLELGDRTEGRTARPDGPSPQTTEAAVDTPHTEVEPTYRVEVVLDEGCVLKSVRAYMVLKRLNYIGTVLSTEPSAQDIEDEKFDQTFTVVLCTGQSPEQIEEAASHITDVESVDVSRVEAAAERGERRAPARVTDTTAPQLSDAQTVRVSISHLDNLVDLVGQLVTVRSRLDTISREIPHKEYTEALEEFGRVSGELQHEVMQTRMVPVGNIFNRFPRMVRDLARDLGVEVDFEMSGLDIELDRTVLDEIGDPIVHLLRNALDHGIEDPATRRAAGKAEKGRVRLVARRERDRVQIIVSDDGQGIDIEGIFAKAVEKGICALDARDSMSTEDILFLTCEPGFSTVVRATKVSGRGVGMDVVKGKIEYLGGSLSISTHPGSGSEFVLTLPLTLAIVQALLVGSGEHIFAIPLSAVDEIVSPRDMSLETVDGKPVVVYREGAVVPLYRLDVIIGTASDATTLPGEGEHLVMIESAEQIRALAVDSLLGRREVVIKPPSAMFKHIKGLAGTAVLGDGRIALILDPRSFFAMGEVTS